MSQTLLQVNLPTETHDASIPRQTPTGEQRCYAIRHFLLGLHVDAGQLFFAHVKLTSIDSGNFLKLPNRISKAFLANQPAWRFNDEAVRSCVDVVQSFRGKRKIENENEIENE